MKLHLDERTPKNVETQCLVIGVYESGSLSPSAEEVDSATGGLITQKLETRDIETGLGKTSLFHDVAGIAAERLLVVGFGKPEKLDLARFDRACVAAGKALRNFPFTQCHSCVHDMEIEDVPSERRLRQAALAIHRANFLYTMTKPLKKDAPVPLVSASFQGGTEYEAALGQATAFAAGYEKAMMLGDLPPNICTPAYLAQEALAIAEKYDNVSLDVLEEDDMAEKGMDSLLAVARGSELDAKLIVLSYSGAAADQPPIALVGKGITFDSGGLSLKSGENMMQMKYDMCGAAGVMGAFVACAEMQLKINTMCIVAAVENMPDGNAYRPGDVITSMSGKTIEVLNTDAEGRLVLCDAITYCQQYNPRFIIDAATLTGACVVALGHHATGLMSNDDELSKMLLDAGESVVDRAWRLPIWEEFQSQLDTPFADMKNIGGPTAGAVTAGCFLARFAEDQRWAHLDVAGTAWNWSKKEGASGRPTGLLAQFLMDCSG